MPFETIELERLGAIGRITLNRPEARNAQNTQLLDELDQAFDALEDDASIRVIILAAKGLHFSAGHDLREGAARVGDFTVEARWAHEDKRYFKYCLRIWDCPKPTIAQVQGGCIAGGFMVANMCDMIVAADGAFFSDPVVHTLSAAAVEVLVHPWVMGLRRAKEMLLTGGKVTASEALAIGMVNKVVPLEELSQTTLDLAAQVGKAPPFAAQLIKRSLNRSQDAQGFRVALNAHFDTHQLSHRSEEYMEARRRGLDSALKRQ